MEPDTDKPSAPLVLGSDGNSIAIRDLRYASEKRTDPDWLAADLVIERDGRRIEAMSSFMNTGDLFGLTAWYRGLLEKGRSSAGEPDAAAVGPAFYFDAPASIEALAWSADGVRLRFKWDFDPPWPQEEPTDGDPSLVVHATTEQIAAMAEGLSRYDDLLPYREGGWDWQTPLILGIIGLLLVLIVVGAVTAGRWLISLLG